MDIHNYIREIKDFPTKGVVFKDITPLLKDPKILEYTLNSLADLIGDKNIDKVVGMESRGFFFGTLLACRLNAGFVPVRKSGKLPHDVIHECYELEYGSNVLEIHKDAILEGEKVLIHDDVLATGGTASATCRLVERLGGEVIQLNFLMELEFLKGKEKLQNYEVKSLLKY